MNEFLEQIVLASRRRGQDWGNILFIVFLAIFWAISGILKAKKASQEKKAVDQKGLSEARVKPSKRTRTEPRGLFQQIRDAVEAELQHQRELQQQAQPTRRKPVSQQQPAGLKILPEPERIKKIPTIESVQKIVPAVSTARIESKIEVMSNLKDETIEKVLYKKKPVAVRSKYLSGILSDYSNSGELRRAILHYEILGRPVSLREPSDVL